MDTLYERIVEQTQKKNMTGKELGALLGLKKSPLTDWKNGKANPTLEQFGKMCEIFAISAEWLLTGKESKDLTPEEQLLVDTFRNCNPVGQQLIQEHAESIREKLPADNIEHPAGVSASAIG